MGKQKILLIDYDPTSVARLIHPLTRAGFSVEVAKDGIEGLAAYDRLKPDLVLVEAMLPRKHGFEVCQEIKRSPGGERTAVMITTAVCRGRKYRTDALQIYGCDEYVEKPIPEKDLLAICRRLLSEIDQIASAKREAGPERPARPEAPVLDEMTDEEIETRLDSLLVDPDHAPETVEAPPAPETPRPESAKRASGKLPDLAQMSEDEIMNRLDALVDEAGAPEPAPQPEPAAPEPEATAEPREPEPIEPLPEPVTAPERQEPVEQPTIERPVVKGRSGPVWAGAIAAGLILIGVLAFGFSQGWFDRAETPAPPKGPAPIAATPPPVFSSEKFRSRAHDAAAITALLDDPSTASAEVPEVVEQLTAPPPAAARPIPEPPPPKRKRTPQPLVEPDPEVDAALRAEILAEPVEAAPSEPGPDLGGVRAETLLGAPVRPIVRGELFELDSVDSPPVVVSKPPPAYDSVALKLKQQGTVVLNLLVDENGKVAEVELVGGIPKSRLNDAAIRAARRWRYRPAEKDGVPVKVWKTETVVFKL